MKDKPSVMNRVCETTCLDAYVYDLDRKFKVDTDQSGDRKLSMDDLFP